MAKKNTDITVTKTKLNSPWLRNALNSLGLAGTEVIKDIMPSTASTIKSVSQSSSEVAKTIRNSKLTSGKVIAAIKGTPAVKFAQQAIDNSLQDLKSGNLYNKEREEKALMGGYGDEKDQFSQDDIDKLFDSTGDVSFSDIDDDTNVQINNNVVNQTQSNGSNDATVRLIQKQSEYQLTAAKAQVDAMVSLTSISLAKNAEIGQEVIGQLTSINSNISALLNYQTENMTKFIDASIAYYEQMTPKQEDPYKGGKDEITSKDLVTTEGGFDLNNYLKYVTQNIKKIDQSATALGNVVGMANTLLENRDALTANPVGAALKMGIDAMIPKITKSAMKQFDNTLKAFIPSVLERIGAWGEDDATLIGEGKRTIGAIFGTRTKRTKDFDLKKVDATPVPYNGMANHAITEIIPKYLRESTGYLQQIAMAVTGKNASDFDKNIQAYDWEEGKYKTVKQMRDEITDNLTYDTVNEFNKSDFGKKAKIYAANLGSIDPNLQESFLKSLPELFLKMEQINGPLRLEDALNRETLINSLQTADEKVKNAYLGMFQNMVKTNDGALISANYAKQRASANRVKSVTGYNEAGEHNNVGKILDGRNIDQMINDRAVETIKQGGEIRPVNPSPAASLPSLVTDIRDILRRGIFVQIRRKLDGVDIDDDIRIPYNDETKGIDGTMYHRDQKTGVYVPNHPLMEGFKQNAHGLLVSAQQAASQAPVLNHFVNPPEPEGPQTADDYEKIFAAQPNIVQPEPEKGQLGGITATFFQKASGVLAGIMNGDSDAAWDAMMKGLGASFTKAGEYISEKFIDPLKESLFGSKDENGYKQNGILSGVNNRIRESYFGLRHMITGEGYIAADGTAVPKANDEEMKNTVKGKLTGMVNHIKEGIEVRLFGEKKEGEEESGKEGLIHKATAGLSSVADSLRKGLVGWKNALFGTNDDEDDEKTQQEVIDSIKEKASEMLPSGMAGAAVGAVGGVAAGGLLGTLVGGPIGGALLGFAGGILSKSEKFQDWLFGTEDHEGFISDKTQEFFHEHGKFLTGGAAVGAITGTITGGGILGTLVGGPVAGALMGLASATVLKSEIFQKFLFGDAENGQLGIVTLGKKWMRNIVGDAESNGGVSGGKLAGMLGIGLGTGGLLGTLVGGPVLGASLGLGAAILAQKDNFHEWLFGKVDEETGVKREGILGQFKNALNVSVFQPIKNAAANFIDDAKNFLQFDVFNKITLIMEPIGDAVSSMIGSLTSFAWDTAKDVGRFIKEDFLGGMVDATKKILQPVTAAATAAGAAIWGATKAVISTPINLVMTMLSPMATALRHGVGLAIKAITTPIGLAVKTTFGVFSKALGVAASAIGTAVSLPFKAVQKTFGFINDKIIGTVAHIGRFGISVLRDVKDAVMNSWPMRLIQTAFKSAQDALRWVQGGMRRLVSPVIDLAKSSVTYVRDQVTGAITKSVKNILHFMNPMTWINGIVDKGRKFFGLAPEKREEGSGLGAYFRKVWNETKYGMEKKDVSSKMIFNPDGSIKDAGKGLPWATRVRLNKEEKERQKNMAKERRQKRKDLLSNQRLIAKYTKNQRSEDTEENRAFAQAAALERGEHISFKGDAIKTESQIKTEKFQDASLDVQKDTNAVLHKALDFILGRKPRLTKDEAKAEAFTVGKAQGYTDRNTDRNIELLHKDENGNHDAEIRIAEAARDRATKSSSKDRRKKFSDYMKDYGFFGGIEVALSNISGLRAGAKESNKDYKQRRKDRRKNGTMLDSDQTRKEMKMQRDVNYEAYLDRVKANREAKEAARNALEERRRRRKEEREAKKKRPHYAKGTDNAKPGPADLGEEGEEMVFTDKGATVVGTNGPEVRDMAGGEKVIPNDASNRTGLVGIFADIRDLLGGIFDTVKGGFSDMETAREDADTNITKTYTSTDASVKAPTNIPAPNIGNANSPFAGVNTAITSALKANATVDTGKTVASEETNDGEISYGDATINPDQSAPKGKTADEQRAQRAAVDEKAEQEAKDKKNTGLMESINEGVHSHNKIWNSIFSKKGIITGALILLAPMVIKLLGKLISLFATPGNGSSESTNPAERLISDYMYGKDRLGDGRTSADVISDEVDGLKNTVGNLLTGNIPDAIKSFLYDKDGNIYNETGARTKLLAQATAGGANMIYEGGKKAIPKVMGGIENIKNLGKDIFKGGKFIGGKIVDGGKFVGGKLAAGGDFIGNAIGNTRAGMAASGLKDKAGRAVSGLKNKIGGGIKNKYLEVTSSAVNGFKYGAGKALSNETFSNEILTGMMEDNINNGDRVASVASKVGKFANTTADKIMAASEKSGITKVIDVVKKFFSSIMEKASARFGSSIKPGKVTKLLSSATGCIKKHFSKISAKIATILGTAAGLATTVIGYAAKESTWVVLGAVNGISGAKRLFRTSSQPDATMMIISGLFGAFSGSTIGSIVDCVNELIVSVTGVDLYTELATLIYQMVAGDDKFAALASGQTELKEAYDASVNSNLESQYNEMIKAGLLDSSVTLEQFTEGAKNGEYGANIQSFADYNDEKNQTLGSRLQKGLKGLGDKAREKLVGKKQRVFVDKQSNTEYRENSDGTFSAYDATTGKPLGTAKLDARAFEGQTGENGRYEDTTEQKSGLLTKPIEMIKGGFNSAKQFFGNFGKNLMTTLGDAGSALTTGFRTINQNFNDPNIDFVSYAKANVNTSDPTNPLHGIIGATLGVGKVAVFVGHLIGKLGSVGGDFLLKKVPEFIGGAVSNIAEIPKHAADYSVNMVKGDPTAIGNADINLDGPFGGLIGSFCGLLKIPFFLGSLPMFAIKGVKGQIDKFIDSHTEQIDAIKTGVGEVWDAAVAGDFSKLHSAGKDNDGGLLSAVIVKLSKAPMLLVTGYNWAMNEIGGLVDKALNAVGLGGIDKDIAAYQATLDQYSDPKKDFSGFMNAKMPNTEGNGLKKFIGGAVKIASLFTVGIPRIFNSIGDTISNAINSIGTSLMDWIRGKKKTDGGSGTGVDWDQINSDVNEINKTEGGSGRRKTAGGRGIAPDTLNGGTYYSQDDSRWASKSYSKADGSDASATMSDTGCGPTAMAMVLSDVSANHTDPVSLARLAQQTGDRDETGTNMNFVQNAASAYGVRSSMERNPSSSEIVSKVRNSNGPVMLLGRDNGNGNSPYTDSGHYVVANGVDSNGNIIINDPRGVEYSGRVSPDELNNNTSAVWTFDDDNSYGGSGHRKNFRNIIRRVVGGRGRSNRDRWMDIVIEVKKQIARSGVGYSSNRYVNITIGGRTIRTRSDCSGFVSACLKFYGVLPDSTQLYSGEMTHQNGLMANTGFTYKTFSNWNLQPGDIVAKSGHTEIYAGRLNGNIFVYNVGSPNSANSASATGRAYKTYSCVWTPGKPGANYTQAPKGTIRFNNSAAASADGADASDSYYDSDTESKSASFFSLMSNAMSTIGSKLFEAAVTGNMDVDWDAVVNEINGDTDTSGSYSEDVDAISGADAGTASGSIEGNARSIFRKLREAGMTDAGAAGVLGCWHNESGLQPKNLENTYNKQYGMTDDQYTAYADQNGRFPDSSSDKAGYGLAQWTYANQPGQTSRKERLLQFAKQKKTSIGNLYTQIAFALDEFKNGSAAYRNTFNRLKSITSPVDAATAVLGGYEMPGWGDAKARTSSYFAPRAQWAQKYYDTFHGKDVMSEEGGNGPKKTNSKKKKQSGAEMVADGIGSLSGQLLGAYLEYEVDQHSDEWFEKLTGQKPKVSRAERKRQAEAKKKAEEEKKRKEELAKRPLGQMVLEDVVLPVALKAGKDYINDKFNDAKQNSGVDAISGADRKGGRGATVKDMRFAPVAKSIDTTSEHNSTVDSYQTRSYYHAPQSSSYISKEKNGDRGVDDTQVLILMDKMVALLSTISGNTENLDELSDIKEGISKIKASNYTPMTGGKGDSKPSATTPRGAFKKSYNNGSVSDSSMTNAELVARRIAFGV